MRLAFPARSVAVIVVLFGAVGVTCDAKDTCPWMNEATAAGYLHGDVTLTVTHTSPGTEKPPAAEAANAGASSTIGDAICEFGRHDASGITKLRIEVITMNNVAASFPGIRGRCGAESQAVRAIGNEAVVCSVKAPERGGVVELVVGRVRERALVVSISAGAGTDQGAVRETALRVAEQVAGFLF